MVDKLLVYQKNARMISDAAIDAGFPTQSIAALDDPEAVVNTLNSILREGDVVLVKGAHGLRMDHIVQALEVEE